MVPLINPSETVRLSHIIKKVMGDQPTAVNGLLSLSSPEPNVNFFPSASKVKGPGYPPNLRGVKRVYPDPSADDRRAAVDYRTEEGEKEGEDEISETEKKELDERKEEIAIGQDLASSVDQPYSAIFKKLDYLLDRKFSAIYRRLERSEKGQSKIHSLLTEGVNEGDPYWNFDNWRRLKGYGAVAGMADRCYAMIFDAIEYNNGVLRDNRQNKKPRALY